MNPADAAAQAAAASDTTLLSMFWSAHIVVKFVMVGLLLSSFWCWTIIVNKTLLFASFKRSMDRFEQVFWSGQSLEELYGELSTQNNTGVASLFVSAMREWKRSFQNAASSFMGLHARLEKVLDVSIAREVERLESNLLFLATVASAGPFVGLFGTVWGIMTAFRSIAASKNTSLAVVAPGIAEALLATAIGLFAAIPALIAYNKLQGDVAKAQARMESFRRRILLHPVAADRPASVERQGGLTPAQAAEEAEIMGMSMAAGRKGGRRRRGVPRYGAMADINMTPFIDIMLVLLIIFMVAAPLLATGVAVDLPQTKAGPLNIDQKPISIAINEQGQLFLMDAPVANDDLIAKLQDVAKDGFRRAHLSAGGQGHCSMAGSPKSWPP